MTSALASARCGLTMEADFKNTAYRLLDLASLFVCSIIGVLVTRRNRYLAKLFLTVLVFFVVCSGPYHLTDLVIDAVEQPLSADALHKFELGMNAVRRAILMLALCNSWITPIVYAAFNEKLRTKLVRLLVCGDGINRVRPTVAVIAGGVPMERMFCVLELQCLFEILNNF